MALSDNEKFELMTVLDTRVYSNLLLLSGQLKLANVKATQYLNGNVKYKDAFPSKQAAEAYFNSLIPIYERVNKLKKDYNSRQTEYQESTLASALREADGVKEAATSYWDKILAWTGLGGALGNPAIILPIIYVVGAVTAIGIIAYFITRYKEKTVVDYDESLDAIAEMCKIDKELCQEALGALNEAKKNEQDQDVFNQIGKGVKTLAILGGGALLAKVGYEIAKDQEWL